MTCFVQLYTSVWREKADCLINTSLLPGILVPPYASSLSLLVLVDMEKYRVLRQIGEGSFGNVFLVAERRTEGKFVLKQINICKINRQERQTALREICVLSTMDHPNIVRYKNLV